MDKLKTRRGIARLRSLVKTARSSLVLLLLAGAAIGAGFYVKSGPEWLLRHEGCRLF